MGVPHSSSSKEAVVACILASFVETYSAQGDANALYHSCSAAAPHASSGSLRRRRAAQLTEENADKGDPPGGQGKTR